MSHAPKTTVVHPTLRKAHLLPQTGCSDRCVTCAGTGPEDILRDERQQAAVGCPAGPNVQSPQLILRLRKTFRPLAPGRSPASRDPQDPPRPQGPAPRDHCPAPRPPARAGTRTRVTSGRAPAPGPAGRGRGRSPVRSSCLTVRSCSPPAPPSPPVPAPPPPSSIFSVFRSRGVLRGDLGDSGRPAPRSSRGSPRSRARRLQNSGAEPSRFPALAALLAPPPPPPTAGTASTAQPNRPLLRHLLLAAAPPTASQVPEPFGPPPPIGRRARASASARRHWSVRSTLRERPAPPQNCCRSAGQQLRGERDHPTGEVRGSAPPTASGAHA